jgi:hypothetical protein
MCRRNRRYLLVCYQSNHQPAYLRVSECTLMPLLGSEATSLHFTGYSPRYGTVAGRTLTSPGQRFVGYASACTPSLFLQAISLHLSAYIYQPTPISLHLSAYIYQPTSIIIPACAQDHSMNTAVRRQRSNSSRLRAGPHGETEITSQ